MRAASVALPTVVCDGAQTEPTRPPNMGIHRQRHRRESSGEQGMHIRKIVVALLAVSFATGGAALAQGSGERRDAVSRQEAIDHEARNQRDRLDADADMRRGNRGNGIFERRDAARRAASGQRAGDMRREVRFQEQSRNGHGAGGVHTWYRGDRLPVEYRHYYYVIDDWREHRLAAPPRGHQWVQAGSDYVLISTASGVIARMVPAGDMPR